VDTRDTSGASISSAKKWKAVGTFAVGVTLWHPIADVLGFFFCPIPLSFLLSPLARSPECILTYFVTRALYMFVVFVCVCTHMLCYTGHTYSHPL
jgi:hypothetical protein